MSSTDILKKKYKRARECAFREIEGEIFIISSRTGGVHVINEVGSRIWQLLDGNSICEEIAQRLSEEFEVEMETARDDLVDFIKELEQKEIVVVCE